MNFINDLPKEQKYSMIQAINYKPAEYVKKKGEKEKIASFLINWFDVCLNGKFVANIFYSFLTLFIWLFRYLKLKRLNIVPIRGR